MPDWKSPAELQLDADIFIKLMHALFALYAWEWFCSLDFDWKFVTGEKKFRWPMYFYFANRYLLLFAMIGIIIGFDTKKEVNCQALYTFNQVAGDAAVGLSSINLSIRTIAVYSHSKPIICLLVLVILGHWSLILQGTLLTAVWSSRAQTCLILKSDNKILAATFIYSMVFDFLVFALNAYKLLRKSAANGAMGTSRLGRLIYKDGLVYFFVAVVANALATVFMILNLNSIMVIMFNVPAAVVSTIAATRVVRRLSNFSQNGAEVYNTSQHTGSHSRGGRSPGVISSPKITNTMSRVAYPHVPLSGVGVHVEMHTMTTTAQEPQTLPTYKKEHGKRGSGSDTDVEYDRKATAF